MVVIMIYATCPHCQKKYELTDDYATTVIVCDSCNNNFFIVDSSGKTQKIQSKHVNQSNEKQCFESDWQKFKTGAEEKLRTAFDLDKIENFNLSDFLGQIFKKHTWAEIEDYLIAGTPSTTPQLSSISTKWPAPWLFFRMILVTVAAVLLLYWKGDFIGATYAFMPWLIFGVIGIPLAILIFFWELNLPKNVSILLLVRIMLISGFLSIAVTVIMHKLMGVDASWSAIWAGPIEETAKALTMLFFLRNKRYCYKLNGLLIGAAVGTGFAFIETGGYAIRHGDGTMLIRALLSPVMHIPWSTIVGAALWRAMQNKPWKFENLLSRKFLPLFFYSIGLHMFWNSPLLNGEIVLKTAITAVLEYTIIVYLLQEGINEIRKLKDEQSQSESTIAKEC